LRERCFSFVDNIQILRKQDVYRRKDLSSFSYLHFYEGSCLSYFSLVRPYTLYEKKILRTHVNIKLIETTKALLFIPLEVHATETVKVAVLHIRFTLCMLDVCACTDGDTSVRLQSAHPGTVKLLSRLQMQPRI